MGKEGQTRVARGDQIATDQLAQALPFLGHLGICRYGRTQALLGPVVPWTPAEVLVPIGGLLD